MIDRELVLISEYFGDDANGYGNRVAGVYKYKDTQTYTILYGCDGKIVDAFETDQHTLQYCMDAAENYTLGISNYDTKSDAI